MGTGYTRNDTSNNIADGNIINAADFDGEYDAIEAAFNSSTGHTHDGTAAEGGPVTVLGPSQNFIASASAVTPSTNAGLSLGTASLKFNDLYIDGTAYIDGLGGNLLIDTANKLQFRDTALAIFSSADGQLDIDSDDIVEFNAPKVILSEDLYLQSDGAILYFGTDDDISLTHVADTGISAKGATGFVLNLQTSDTTVESGNALGKITFNAPDEASGTDAVLVGASIEALAEDTFSSTVNSTALVFKTNTSAAATERMRIKSDGDIVFTGANYNMTWDTSADTLRFADGAKANFGASDDLQIYHDGSNSRIVDSGTGSLVIQATNFGLNSADNSDNFLTTSENAGVTVYYDGVAKLATTTDGIDVTGDISVGNLNLITNTISSTDTNGDINLSPNGTGTVVINTDLDVDNININGNTISSTDANGDINITPNGTGKVILGGGFIPSEINLTSTDAGATQGPTFDIFRDSATPADSDAIGAVEFTGNNDADEKTVFAKVAATILDASDTTEDGRLDFRTLKDGSEATRLRIDPTETIFNEAGSASYNFRVESENNTHALFVDSDEDRVGINDSDPADKLHVSINTNNSAAQTTGGRTDNSAGGLFIENQIGAGTSGAFAGITLRSYDYDAKIIAATTGTSNSGLLKILTEDVTAGEPVERVTVGGSSIVFNQPAADYNFRVETEDNPYMFYIDSGNEEVMIGDYTTATGSISTSMLSVGSDTAANATIYSSTLGIDYTGTSSAAGTGSALTFNGTDGSDNRTFAKISGVKDNSTNADYDGRMEFWTRLNGGNLRKAMALSPNGHLQIGDDLTELDFATSNKPFRIQVTGDDFGTSGIAAVRAENGTSGASLVLGHTRATAAGTSTVLTNGDEIGKIRFYGADGSGYVHGASITAFTDGTMGSGKMPSVLEFETAAATGTASGLTRMAIHNDKVKVYEDFYVQASKTDDSGLRIQAKVAQNLYGFGTQPASTGNVVFTNEQGTTNQAMMLGDIGPDTDGLVFGISAANTSADPSDGTTGSWTKLLELEGNGALVLPLHPACRLRWTHTGEHLDDALPSDAAVNTHYRWGANFLPSDAQVTLSEQVDNGNDVNSNGLFTAPSDGVYQISSFFYHQAPDNTFEQFRLTHSINGAQTEFLIAEMEQNPTYSYPRIQGFSALYGLNDGDTLTAGIVALAGGANFQMPTLIISIHKVA